MGRFSSAKRSLVQVLRDRENAMIVDFHESGDGWRWHVKAKNGRIIAESGEAYSRERDARKAWARFELLMQTRGNS